MKNSHPHPPLGQRKWGTEQVQVQSKRTRALFGITHSLRTRPWHNCTARCNISRMRTAAVQLGWACVCVCVCGNVHGESNSRSLCSFIMSVALCHTLWLRLRHTPAVRHLAWRLTFALCELNAVNNSWRLLVSLYFFQLRLHANDALDGRVANKAKQLKQTKIVSFKTEYGIIYFLKIIPR